MLFVAGGALTLGEDLASSRDIDAMAELGAPLTLVTY